MTFIKEFKNRGYLHQCTNLEILEKKSETEKIVAYIGFDCTAPSLHVGNLMQVMILRLLQQHGHKPVVLIGGGTTKIGDPTGREEARRILTDEDILSNSLGIKKSLSKFIKFGDGPSDAVMVNNANWLNELKYLDFLREFGCLFSVNRMLTMDSVKLRLEREQSLTFLEFNYMLLQAYDS
jgi:tyrosyl-tRNA synthetase